jgi:dihydroneopterin triphosphate diphosphatase
MPHFLSTTIQAQIAWFDTSVQQWKFLVLQRAEHIVLYPLVWQGITGTIQPGETALSAAWREIEEETGINLAEIWVVPYIGQFFDAERDAVQSVPSFAGLVSAPTVLLSGEHCAYEWLCEQDALERIAMPTQRNALRVLIDEILTPLAQNYTIPFRRYSRI